jgi:hypothetical protein
MDIEAMSREELIDHIREMNHHLSNVIVMWGGIAEMRQTLEDTARNETGDYTEQEAANAALILQKDGAFDELIQLLRESFDRGGINYVLSEKITALMQEVATRYTGK